MKAYVYDKDTKEYLYETTIQENPKHPGEYLMPDNCTLIEPKSFSTGTATCFINGFNALTSLDIRNTGNITDKTDAVKAQIAKEQNVKPFIVVGRLQKDHIIDYSEHNDLIPKYSWA